MHKHATVSAWNRSEEGGYVAEINGWALHVTWTPEAPGRRRGFSWTAKSPDGKVVSSTHLEEEIELAMHDAEKAAGQAATSVEKASAA